MVDRHWLSEYSHGQAHELYSVPMSNNFFHKLYPVVVHICFLQASRVVERRRA